MKAEAAQAYNEFNNTCKIRHIQFGHFVWKFEHSRGPNINDNVTFMTIVI